MTRKNYVALTGALVLSFGCSIAPPMPDPGRDHPASVDADEAPRPARSATLAIEAVPAMISHPESAPGVGAHHAHGAAPRAAESRREAGNAETRPPESRPAHEHHEHHHDGEEK